MNRKKLLSAIFLLSAALISFQLVLIQILSIVQWYHFAYMVISMALLGFGAAASVLAIFQKRLLKHSDTISSILMMATAIATSLVTDISQLRLARFDSYLLFSDYSHIGRIVVTYLLFCLPFFLGALVIGLTFVRYVDDIGKIYFANLLGSGAGGLLALLLIRSFFPQALPALIAILPLISALILLPNNRRALHFGLGLVAVAVITWKVLYPPQLILSEYKDLSKTMLLPEAKITLEKASPYGIIQAVSSPALRYAPGMSLTAQKTAQIKRAVFINGDWFGAVTDWKKTDSSMILDFTTLALPYTIAQRNSVLVLQSGTGIDVAHAVSRKANNVVAVESNQVILSVLQHQLAGETDSLFTRPNVTVHNLEPRTFLSQDESRYDLITLPIVGTFGGSSGLYSLHEQFLLTREAFREMWLKLNEGGAISITSWMDYPVRNPLKILSTMVEVLTDAGIQNAKDYIVAVRSWGTITFVMKKTPLQTNEINKTRVFCEAMMFDPAILPQLTSEERSRYNEFQDARFFEFVDKIFSNERNSFYKEYNFNIQPATDNKPYFSQYIKWTTINRLAKFFGGRTLPFFELGYLLIIVTLVQISVVSFILILLPLFKLGWNVKNKMGIVLYFSGIGLGYMFTEIIFIQRFILYFGNPVYSAAVVITALLIFSGLGSYYSRYISFNRKWLLGIFGFIVCMLLLYSFALTAVLQLTVHLNFWLKLLIVFLLVAPLAFCMGIPFPSGLSDLSKLNKDAIPWAWGINGCVSVISTALATLIGIEMGFIWVLLLTTVAYCLPLERFKV